MSERGPLDFDDDDERPSEERPPEERWAHRRDPDLPPPSPDARRGHVPVPRPPMMSRYTWFLGVVAFLLVVVALINGIGSDGPGSKGIPSGQRLLPFAAPLVDSPFGDDADVNVQRGGAGDEAGRVRACDVRGEVLNICDLWRRGPVVLAFFATRNSGCIDQLDALEKVRRRSPSVGFAAVSIRGDRDRARELAEGRGWGFPVAYDHDGLLANIYGVAVCPHITFAERGGKVVDTTFGELSEDELAAQVERLAR